MVYTSTYTDCRKSEHVAVQDADVFDRVAVLHVRDQLGTSGYEIVPLAGAGAGTPQSVVLPPSERGSLLMAHANADPGASSFRFASSGPLTPLNQWSIDLDAKVCVCVLLKIISCLPNNWVLPM